MLRAGDSLDPSASQALAELCERYWYPVYAFLRRRGQSVDDAQDLAQSFFVHLLERRTVKAADPGRGRFRSFLLTALKFHVADQRAWQSAKKRGGGVTPASLDFEMAEEKYQLEGDPEETPDRLFDRRWALEVLETTYRQLREELARSAHPERVRLVDLLTGEGPAYAVVGEELGMSTSAVKVAMHRLRQRFGSSLRDQVSQTVDDPSKVDDELRYLLRAVGDG